MLGPHARKVPLHRHGYLGKGHLACLLWSGSLRKPAAQQLISIFFFFIAGVSGDSALDSVSYHCGLLAKYATSPDLSFLKGVGIDSHSSTTL